MTECNFLFNLHIELQLAMERKPRQLRRIDVPIKTVDLSHVGKFDKLLIAKEVARTLNVTDRTIRNFKIKRVACVELSERKFYYNERDILLFVNRNYYPAQIVDEQIPPPLTAKDKLLCPRQVVEFFRRNLSKTRLNKYRDERRIGYVKLGDTLFRYPERDLMLFVNRNYQNALTYEE
jgi:hypothetical protein